jgi:hypothetical protein
MNSCNMPLAYADHSAGEIAEFITFAQAGCGHVKKIRKRTLDHEWNETRRKARNPFVSFAPFRDVRGPNALLTLLQPPSHTILDIIIDNEIQLIFGKRVMVC